MEPGSTTITGDVLPFLMLAWSLGQLWRWADSRSWTGGLLGRRATWPAGYLTGGLARVLYQ
jgi:hypothetical protein